MLDDYFEQGLILFEAGDYAPAVEQFTKALRLSLGDLAETLLYRGICYAYLEAYDKAMADFTGALQRNPYYPDAYNERGNLLRLEGRAEAAIADYTVALRLDGKHYAAYYNRALAYEMVGNYEAAAADLNQIIELNPTIAPAYEVRGRVRANLRDFSGAIADLERYLRMGGGREYDNQSEIQSFIINLRVGRILSYVIPVRFIPGLRRKAPD